VRAALGDRAGAESELQRPKLAAGETGQVIEITDFLARRFCFGPHANRVPSDNEIAALDEEIDRRELGLVLRLPVTHLIAA